MKKEYLKVPARECSFQQVFGGLDRRTRIDETQMSDMLNLTSDNYPVLSTRPRRGTWCRATGGTQDAMQGLFAFGSDVLDAVSVNGGIVFCTRDGIYASGNRLPGILPDRMRRRISPFGKNFFIIPDGAFISESGGSYTFAYAGVSNTVSGEVSIYMSDENSVERVPGTVSVNPPAAPLNGDSWLDTSVSPARYRVYSSASEEWETSESCYVTLSGSQIGISLRKGDTVTVSGCSVSSLNGSKTLVNASAGNVTFCGVSAAASQQNGFICVTRRMPVLDFIVEHNNRLWGCRYGENDEGEFVNEIYASKLGDALSWFACDGISTDSYCASVGCPGEFTGVGKTDGSIVFFKEDYIIKVRGSEPSDFQVLTLCAKGIQSGSDRSCVSVNGVLFYKSCEGITAYDGVSPVCVSEALGTDIRSNVRAGYSSGKYYAAMTDEDGNSSLYVYDTLLGLWHREDNESGAELFVCHGNCLYMFCNTAEMDAGPGSDSLYSVKVCNIGSPGKYSNIFKEGDLNESDYVYLPEKDVAWYAESGETGLSSPDDRILRALKIRIKLGERARIRLAVMLNSDGEWRELYESPAKMKGSFTVTAPFPVCDTYRLRLSGEGECKVYSITKLTEAVSGVRMLE